MASIALVALIYNFAHAVTRPSGGYDFMLIGFPVIVAGMLLAIRYRRDMRAHPWHLLAGAGAGGAGFYLMMIPDRLGMREHLLSRSSSWGVFVPTIVIWFLFLSCVGSFVPWLYRHALRALTFRRREQLPIDRDISQV